jgi:hypothetical protein
VKMNGEGKRDDQHSESFSPGAASSGVIWIEACRASSAVEFVGLVVRGSLLETTEFRLFLMHIIYAVVNQN